MSYLGDRAALSTIVFDFTTAVNGVPATLGGSPVLSCYKNSLTEGTTGITLTVDYDGRAGMNHVVIDTSADTSFFAADNDFSVVITTGTVDSISVVGTIVGNFRLSTKALRLDKTTNVIGRGTCTTGGSTTSITTSAMSPSGAVADQYKGRIVIFDGDTTTAALRGQAAAISASSNAAAPTFTVSALTTAPVSGDTFSVV